MSKIAIDVSCWQNYRGNGRFTRELVTSMVRQYNHDHEFIFITDEITAKQASFPTGVIIKSIKTKIQPIEAASSTTNRSVLDVLKFSQEMLRCQPDVIFFPSPYTYFPVFNQSPVVLCLHDTMTETLPELFFDSPKSQIFWQMKLWLARKQAQKIVCPSNSAKHDVANFFKIPVEDIAQINEAPAPQFTPINNQELIDKTLNRYKIPVNSKIILYVGGVSPHKNLDRLVKSLKQLENKNWQLVIVGDYVNDSYLDCYDQLKSLIEDLHLSSRINFTGYVPDNHLVCLYNAATILVLPSLDEGFGLPVIEAMACGTPVAVSKHGSLPEIVADAGLIFDPLNTDEMTRSVSRLLNDSNLRNSLSQKGIKRSSLYSWEKAAEKIMKILIDVM